MLIQKLKAVSSCVFLVWCSHFAGTAYGQLAYEKEPIAYLKSEPTDRMARLIQEIESGEVRFEYSAQHGWLPSLLEALEIDERSQLLVFSKTSLQLRKISPKRPRALYFNDDAYVGWCQGGDFLEVAVADKDLGAVFYTLDQENSEQPIVKRDRGQCLSCHANHRTQDVPGFVVRSIHPDFNGRPRTGTRTYVTDHTSNFGKRFGGWYVTGEHGDMRHMGNVFAEDRLNPEELDRDAGANKTQLQGLCNTEPYLTGHSDLVALMVLEHQTQMHNYIARASIEARIARHYDQGINEALKRPLNHQSDSTKRRIAAAGEDLVRYMLFADEVQLTSPITGSTEFQSYFESAEHPEAKTDRHGRSLRELDMKTRMFKYPCSFLIYSEAFEALPNRMNEWVRSRLSEILLSEEVVEGYENLDGKTRQAIVEILAETKPGYLKTKG